MPQTTETLSLGLDSSPMLRGFRMASAASDKFTKGFKKNMRAIATAGREMTMKLTVPIVSALTLSGKSWVDFQDQMVKSTAIMSGVTTDLRAEMEATAKSLSELGPKSAAELAESYFFLASAGMDARQSISALAVVMRFATAGAFDMATATDLLTDAQSALGLASKDAAENESNLLRISDVFVKANTLANSSVRQISEAMTNDGAAAANELGQSMETTTALLSAYADKGQKGAVAGSMLGRAFRLTAAAARENAAAFQKYNIRVVDASTGEYRNFINILDDMNVAFAGMTKPQIGAALKDLGIETLAQKAITPLLGLTDKLKAYEAALRSAGGTTQSVFEKQMESPLNKLKVLMNTFQNTAMAMIDSWAFWPLVAVAALGPLALAIASVTFVVDKLGIAYGFLTSITWANTKANIANTASSISNAAAKIKNSAITAWLAIKTGLVNAAQLAFNVSLIVATGLLYKNGVATTVLAAKTYVLTSALNAATVAFAAMIAKAALFTAAFAAGYWVGKQIRKIWSNDDIVASALEKAVKRTKELNKEFARFLKLTNVGEKGTLLIDAYIKRAKEAEGVPSELLDSFRLEMQRATGQSLKGIDLTIKAFGKEGAAEFLRLSMLYSEHLRKNAALRAAGDKVIDIDPEQFAMGLRVQDKELLKVLSRLDMGEVARIATMPGMGFEAGRNRKILEKAIKIREGLALEKPTVEGTAATDKSVLSAQKASLAVAGSIEAYRAERRGRDGIDKMETATVATADNTAEANKILMKIARNMGISTTFNGVLGIA